MLTDLKVNKPTPIAFSKTLKSFKRDTDIALTIENLVKGKPILIKDFYSDGMALLKRPSHPSKLKTTKQIIYRTASLSLGVL